MPTYTNQTKLALELPEASRIPSELDSDQQDAFIADASELAESLVGQAGFNDITDDPATPAIIERIARYLAASECWRFMKQVGRSGNDTKADDYLAKVTNKDETGLADRVRNGELAIFDANGVAVQTADPAYSTTADIDPTFSRGQYNDGSLVGDAGTLDDFAIDRTR